MPRRVRFNTRQSLSRATARAWCTQLACSRAFATVRQHSVKHGENHTAITEDQCWSEVHQMHFVMASTELFTDTRDCNCRIDVQSAGKLRWFPLCASSSIPAGSPVKVSRRSWRTAQDRKSTRLNSSHLGISYAVFCLKK